MSSPVRRSTRTRTTRVNQPQGRQARPVYENWRVGQRRHMETLARNTAPQMIDRFIFMNDGVQAYDRAIRNSNPNNHSGGNGVIRHYYEILYSLLRNSRPRFLQLWTAQQAAAAGARLEAEAARQVNHGAVTANFLGRIRNRAVRRNWSNIKNSDPISLKNANNWNGNHGIGIKMASNTKYFTVNTFRRIFGTNWLNLPADANLPGRNPFTRGLVKRGNVVIARFEGNKPAPKRNGSPSPKRNGSPSPKRNGSPSPKRASVN